MQNQQLNQAAQPVNARVHLSDILRNRMAKWLGPVFNAPGFVVPDPDKIAMPKVAAVLAIYDEALARLEGKTGTRADAARERITAARAPLAAGRDLVDSIGADFNGVLANELCRRIDSTRSNLGKAIAAKEVASRQTVEVALLEIERCLADIRELDREIASIYERLIVPPLPDNLENLQLAEASTRALQQQVKNPSAAQVHAAIEEGLKASDHVAALWIAYEAAENDLVQWRWRGYAERGT